MSAPREYDLLLHRYLDGSATESELRRLDAVLRSDPAARREYAELMNLDSALVGAAADWAAAKESPEFDSVRARVPARRGIAFPRGGAWLATAAALILIAAGVWWSHTMFGTFATVASEVGVAGLSPGTTLGRGPIELQAGTVELITTRGVRVVIEAPAAFRFESAQRLRVLHGRVAAQVPASGKGFTVLTPTGSAIDLGTEFGVDVPRHGEAEIHVFSGEVIARSAGGGTPQSLRDGEAFALQKGAGEARAMRSAAFIRPEEMAGLSAGLSAGQRALSEQAGQRLRRDPALIGLLDFETDEAYEGTFRWVQGRWPGSRAPEFVQIGDRIKLDLGGERTWPQFSLAAWVRIDQLGAPYQSLYHSDGWHSGNKPGQVHWMINRDMTMRLAIRGNTLPPGAEERHGFPDSRTSVLPEQGRWMHLAVVYDSERRTVRFYLNGTLDKESLQEIAGPAQFGAAQIGNWEAADRKLSGRMDDLLLLGRAMSDDEIQALFAAGNPYQ